MNLNRAHKKNSQTKIQRSNNGIDTQTNACRQKKRKESIHESELALEIFLPRFEMPQTNNNNNKIKKKKERERNLKKVNCKRMDQSSTINIFFFQ